MSKYLFKTNINCIGCVTQIKPYLDNLEKDRTIEHWHVNLNNPEYLLEIETNKLTPDEAKGIIQAQGFEADLVKAPKAR